MLSLKGFNISALCLTRYVQELTVGNGLELAVWKCYPSAAPEGESLNEIKLSRTHARTKITSEKISHNTESTKYIV